MEQLEEKDSKFQESQTEGPGQPQPSSKPHLSPDSPARWPLVLSAEINPV